MNKGAQPSERIPTKVVAVVLASGLSARMGADKLWMPIDGQPMVLRVLEAVRECSADDWVVVCREPEVFSGLGIGDHFIANPHPEQGMGASIALGVSWVQTHWPNHGAMIVLGDMPWQTSRTLDVLLAAYRIAQGEDIVVPSFEGRRGNPVVFPSDLLPHLAALSGDSGARSVIESHAHRVSEVCVARADELRDVDVAADLT